MSYHRKSLRLSGYDYSQAGAYFVTICTAQKAMWFENDGIKQIAEKCWQEIPQHFPMVELDEWAVMPNHIHGIIVIEEGEQHNGRGVQLNAPTNRYSAISPRKNTLSVIIRTYKASVTTQCRRRRIDLFQWQRNYYEHVIRHEAELARLRQYIANNPLQWNLDAENAENRKGSGVQLNALQEDSGGAT